MQRDSAAGWTGSAAATSGDTRHKYRRFKRMRPGVSLRQRVDSRLTGVWFAWPRAPEEDLWRFGCPRQLPGARRGSIFN